MSQRWAERARRAVFFAQEEAENRGEKCVSPEHLLLGLVREVDCVAVVVLGQLGVRLDVLRARVEKQMTRGEEKLGQDMRLTARAKRAIDLAYDEARTLNNNYIGTEHLLLGLVREGGGVSGRVLTELGVEIEETRAVTQAVQARRGPTSNLVEMRSTMLLRGRSVVSISDLSADDIKLIFSMASLLKDTGRERTAHLGILAGRTLAMIFEKPSLRTRVTFEVGMTQLGGHAIYLAPSDIQLGVRETIADAARNLSRWCDVIMARVFAHSTVTELAEHASIPVINGLSDLEHPCQALADFYTIREKKRDVKGLKLAYIGDGNNVANSLMLLAAKLGTHFAIACPEGYEPDSDITAAAREIAKETGSSIQIVRNPSEAADGADVLYTDVWASMGQESEREERKKVFKKYQINQKLLSKAKPDAIVLHCLPAHRGEEITDEVIDGPQSAVLDESENRLHVQKAVLALVV